MHMLLHVWQLSWASSHEIQWRRPIYTCVTKPRNRSPRETKSVSLLTSTTATAGPCVPTAALATRPTRPSEACREDFLAAAARPFFRNASYALSMSQPHWTRHDCMSDIMPSFQGRRTISMLTCPYGEIKSNHYIHLKPYPHLHIRYRSTALLSEGLDLRCSAGCHAPK